MKIIDNGAIRHHFTLDDADVGDVVRLQNGRLYLIGGEPITIQGFPSSIGTGNRRWLINLETGRTHLIKNGHKTECTVERNAVLTVEGS